VKPIFSNEERIQAVKNFVVARYNHQAKISSFERIAPYLNEGRIELLCELKWSGYGESIYDASGNFRGHKRIFDKDDAKTYFEWLIAVVTGAENVTENTVKHANDQLFQFIHVLGDSVYMEKNVQLVSPYDWQELFSSFDKRLAEMENTIDKADKDIVATLKLILEWMRKYDPLLSTLDKENKKLFGEGKNQ
jgi:hypothetical protein